MMKRTIAAMALGLCVMACDESTSTPTEVKVKETIPGPAATMPAMPATTQAASVSASATVVANTLCPLSGEKVDPKGKTVAYEGKTVGFCCDECVEPFQKEPAKYAANLK